MWHRDGRKFWFHSGSVQLFRLGECSSTPVQLLDAALERWETSSGDVALSGDWGWCDPVTGRFDYDDYLPGRKEEWED